MTLKEAVKRNPYRKEKGSTGAYIRYLRYNVDGWYNRKSEEIVEIIEKLMREGKLPYYGKRK